MHALSSSEDGAKVRVEEVVVAKVGQVAGHFFWVIQSCGGSVLGDLHGTSYRYERYETVYPGRIGSMVQD